MLREAIKALVSGLVVYLVVVTCTSSGAPDATAEAGDGVSLDAMADGYNLDAVAPCECPPPLPEYTKAGSRLRPMYILGADGSKASTETPGITLPGAMFDTERNEPCYWGVAEDGSLRCLPERIAFGHSYFSDEACKQPVAGAGTTPCAAFRVPTSAFDDNATECGVQFRALVGEVDRAALYQVNAMTGACEAVVGSETIRYFAIGNVIPPTAFVEGTVTHD